MSYVTNPLKKKHRTFILAIDRDYLTRTEMHYYDSTSLAFHQPINEYPHEQFLTDVQSDLVIREREYLDNATTTLESRRDTDGAFRTGNPNYAQVLPYLVARQHQIDGEYLYFPYRRTSKVGESRLAGNGSIGYGGHVDLEDIIHRNSVIDFRATIIQSLLREASEEFTVTMAHGHKVDVKEEWFSFADLFILDNSNAVGELHLGLVIHLDIPEGYSLAASEDELTHVEPATGQQLLLDPTFKPENWTAIYLKHQHVKYIAGSKNYNIDHGGKDVGQIDPELLEEYLNTEEPESTSPAETAVIDEHQIQQMNASTGCIPKMWPVEPSLAFDDKSSY